jgi:hypothetical protein
VIGGGPLTRSLLILAIWVLSSTFCSHCTATTSGPALADSLSEDRIFLSALYASRYSFQGLDYSSSRPVLQVSVAGIVKGQWLSAWVNLDQARRECNEIDLSVQHDWQIGRLSGALGYTHLRYPHRNLAPSHELFAALDLDSPLDPSLTLHWDVAAGAGRYWTLGLDHEFVLHSIGLRLSTRLYAHDSYYDVTGIPAFEAGLVASTAIGKVAVQPTVLRLWAWPNGDFRGNEMGRGPWVVALALSYP